MTRVGGRVSPGRVEVCSKMYWRFCFYFKYESRAYVSLHSMTQSFFCLNYFQPTHRTYRMMIQGFFAATLHPLGEDSTLLGRDGSIQQPFRTA